MWTLANITEEQFDEVYAGLDLDKSIFQREPTSDEDLVLNFMTSKLWRMNNLYTIVGKQGNRQIFQMNYAQHRVYAASLWHARLIILKSRQQGISTFWLICYLDDGLVNSDYNIGMMAQGQKEAGTLLKRVKLAWDTINPALTSVLSVGLDRDNAAEQGFSNNSTIYISTSFRSATLQRLHISEFGKIAKAYPERARETKTGTLQAIQAGNTVVIESTAEGDNEFKRMWEQAVENERRYKNGEPYAGKDFKPVFLSWLEDPDCVQTKYESPNQNQLEYFKTLEEELGVTITTEQRNFWIAQYRELGDDIKQEYPATPEEAFTKANDGAYYAKQYMNRVIRKGRRMPELYDPNLEVYVLMDLGIHDTFTLAYVQEFRGEYRIVDEYTNHGEGLSHYVEHMFNSGYDIQGVYCPPDITVQELGTGKSRLAVLRELGVTNITVLPKLSIEAGIERVRKDIIPNLWIDEKCDYLDGCLRNYAKEWDDKLERWKNKPLHDKWSHGADVIRYLATANISHKSQAEQFYERRDNAGVVGGLAF